ncbi:MAG: hypothetical protein J4215_04465 [Candidatus Diapherotrites archaeon]|uniref:Uncharacterized protein n=1 Tax=Candidatus Iainarchaeum sp. TaxID=3101447 RepID=A0A8T4L5D0_9ARCH|nr:hypothetical protein [Candidatus Diapherotrites archaeon]
MKICIWPNTSLRQIPLDTMEIHLARPISRKKITEIINKRPIHTVTLSKSTFVRINEKTLDFLEKRKIKTFIHNNPGKPLQIPLEQIIDVIERVKDHQSLRKIEHITGIPKSTVHYLVKYAKRTKAKKGNKPIHLR